MLCNYIYIKNLKWILISNLWFVFFFREGPNAFFGDILFRLKKFIRRKLRLMGLIKNRRVKLKDAPQIRCTCAKKSSSKDDSLSDYEFADEEFCT